MDLNEPPNTVLSWIAMLLTNRTFSLNSPRARRNRDYLVENFLPDVGRADVIKGYRADDSYFRFARDFVSNEITVSDLELALHLGGLGTQFVLKSERSFRRVRHVETTTVDANIYRKRYMNRDRAARARYGEISFEGDDPKNVYVSTIVEEGWPSDDPRLRRGVRR